jgi:hypothetical protein
MERFDSVCYCSSQVFLNCSTRLICEIQEKEKQDKVERERTERERERERERENGDKGKPICASTHAINNKICIVRVLMLSRPFVVETLTLQRRKR